MFTQLIIRSGLITLEQYQEILGIRANIEEKLGIRKPIEEIIVERGFLHERVVRNLLQKIGAPQAPPQDAVPESSRESNLLLDGDILDNPPVPPNYRLAQKLGEGSMGAVFKAQHLPTNQDVAIKFLDPRYNTDKEFVHRFLREAKTVSQLQHPNIVRALEYGEHKGIYYFVMEYLRGQSLAKILDTQGRMSAERAVNILLQIARAMQYAHGNGFIHRDIKPENIMVDADHAKLCDFGLIRGNEKETLVTQVGAFIGTPQYVSPEQARGLQDIDGRADIYSLGCTLYHMVIGTPPYAHSNPIVVLTWQATRPFPDPLESAPDLSPKLANAIRQMTAKDRDMRIQSMDILVQKLLEIGEREDADGDLRRMTKTQKRTTKDVASDAEKSKGKRVVGRRRKLRESAVKSRENKMRETGIRKVREPGEKKKSDTKKILWGLVLWIVITAGIGIILVWQMLKL